MRTRHALAASVAAALGLLISITAPTAAETKSPAASKPSAAQSTPIDATNAEAIKAAIGKRAVVIGTVDKASWSKSGKVMRIVFKGDGTSTPFEAVVFEKTKEAVDQKFDGDAAKALGGAMVRVTGTVATYSPRNNPDEKHPQIVISDVKQIELQK